MPTSDRAVRAILFDLDGTLIDTYRLYVESYRRALTPFLGREPTLDDFLERRPASERHFLTEWLGEPEAEACHAEVRRHYAELHRSHCEGLYDGVREMLAALRSAGIPLGIVTGKGRHAWEVTRGAIDLGDWGVVVTEDDAARPKPDPAGLRLALQQLSVAPAEAVYIGDSVSDLRAGRNAGTRVAGALWPKVDPTDRAAFVDQVQPIEPEWMFERPADVVRQFAMWCG